MIGKLLKCSAVALTMLSSQALAGERLSMATPWP